MFVLFLLFVVWLFLCVFVILFIDYDDYYNNNNNDNNNNNNSNNQIGVNRAGQEAGPPQGVTGQLRSTKMQAQNRSTIWISEKWKRLRGGGGDDSVRASVRPSGPPPGHPHFRDGCNMREPDRSRL